MSTVKQRRKSNGQGMRMLTKEEEHDENQRILRTKFIKALCSWLIIFPGAIAIICSIWITLISHEFYRIPKGIVEGDLIDYQPINLRIAPSINENNRDMRKCWTVNGEERCSISWGTIFFCKRPVNYTSIDFNSANMTASCFPPNSPPNSSAGFAYGAWTPIKLSDGHYEEEGFDLVPPINYLLLITAIFSFLGSTAIIVTFCKSKALQNKRDLHFIFFMSIADLGFAFKFILSASFIFAGKLEIINSGIYGTNKEFMVGNKVSDMCLVSGILGQFFGLSTICWNCSIALNLIFNMKLSKKYTRDKKKHFEIFSHIFSWGFPAITCIIGLATENFAMTYDGTCWLWGDYVLMFYVPLFIFMGINCYAVYVGLNVITPNTYLMGHRLSHVRQSLKHFTRRSTAPKNLEQQKRKELERKARSGSISSEQEAKKMKSFNRILTYCLAFISTWIWGIVLRLGTFGGWNDLGVFNSSNMSSYEAASPPPWLVFASAFYLGAGGAINASIWLEPLTREARKGVVKKLRRASRFVGLSTKTQFKQNKHHRKISKLVQQNTRMHTQDDSNNTNVGSNDDDEQMETYVENPLKKKGNGVESGKSVLG